MCKIMNLPEVLRSLQVNKKNKYPQVVFENGFTIQVDENADTGARNENHLTVAMADSNSQALLISSLR